jgi:microcompartment protein CcmK/EutM
MSCNTSSYNLGVVGILLGEDTAQTTCIVAKADVSSSLQNKYFILHEPVTQLKHYFWMNVGGAGVDPAVPVATGHAVAISANATAIAVATAVSGVIDALAWAASTATGEHIEVTFVTNGYAYEGRDALAEASRTNFTITVSQFGQTQVDVGATSGDTTVTIDEQLVDITAPQYGDFVLEEIRKGLTGGAAFEMKDTSVANVRRALNFYGSTIVTDDASAKVITGYGSKNLFKSTSDVSTKLVFRPLKFVADQNPSEDFTFHKAKLKLGELTFSAENELVLPVEAVVYLDLTKAQAVNFFSYGDAGAIPVA